jgi:hypothetical protein
MRRAKRGASSSWVVGFMGLLYCRYISTIRKPPKPVKT